MRNFKNKNDDYLLSRREGKGAGGKLPPFLRNKGVCRHSKARRQCTIICFEVLRSKVGYTLRLLAFDRILLKIMAPKPGKIASEQLVKNKENGPTRLRIV